VRTRSFLSALITTTLTAAAILALPSQPAKAVHCPTFGSTRDAGTIADGSLNELSALQASIDHHGVLWSVEDSGNGPYLWAVNAHGRLLARFRERGNGVTNVDQEALALTHRRGRDVVWVGDIGDNAHNRDGRSRPLPALYRVSEPSITATSAYRTGHVTATRYRFRYYDPSGTLLPPRNAEALFVDPRSRWLFVIQKDLETLHGNAHRARVFVLRPGRLRARRVNAARQVASIVGSSAGTVGPVAADISRDGTWIAVKNYRRGWLWHRAAGTSVAAVFTTHPSAPCSMPVGRGESIAFGYGPAGRWRRTFSVRERAGGYPPLMVTPRG
jgi:hypothetical protein